MIEELINFDLPQDRSSIIKVIGVGGGGSNAVNHMFRNGIKDVNFVVCNTDAQALLNSPVSVKIQLGESLTEGRGAGNKPEIGRQAAIENIDDVIDVLNKNTKMVFITAGMGGGTGTGAAPVIAKAAKELGLLTVAIVTIPFRFEGDKRINQAIEGINEIEKYVDSLLVINNERLRQVCGNLKFSEAFSYADNVLATAAKGIAEIITVPGYINVDFADVETVLSKSGVALMGTGMAEGENRAIKAVQQALASPLLNDNDIKGTENMLLNITFGSNEITMDEIGEIADYVNSEVGSSPNIIWGTGYDEKLGEQISITIIATGFKSNSIPELYAKKTEKTTITLLDSGTIERKKSPVMKFEKEPIIQKDSSLDFSQRTLDFDIRSTREKDSFIVLQNPQSETEVIIETKKSDIQKKLKEAHEKNKEHRMDVSKVNENLDEIENEPAYKRKNLKIEQPLYSQDSKVSRYSLEDDDEITTRLNTNNSYLHDNVD
ncbi:MAG: cell division protein FtsZ [Bacteroidetes bacterium GWC2_33_15]|nr:MAG: cell division protein FtsZ [Bacteroidetes bacterium GWA2_33_15]OFX51261.1 MAG: cell division protein FtsZ [Bacteroidetes bacterium GWC2_33_15]OFX66371.1 MAG: cell division protein FtsZ [Bacteroidetes bacterium GWB2_32_14]OFX70664.1 MAG: cell division protein FtsZ [Bacteroidetes bacterium GWD2_33_33]HAN20051.1 cell division protein FtsZ [Bacteroidales bacterium]